VVWLPTAALAQAVAAPADTHPRLLHVMPMGGQAGSTFEVAVDGPGLTQPLGLHFSHPGIKAEPLGMDTSPAPEVVAKKKKAAKPQPILRQRFRVTLPPDTPLGIHDVRFVGARGVSNPRAFVVGDLKELVEKEPNNDVDQAQRVELGSSIDGVIASPTDVDYFAFAGKRGQRVIVSCLASSIDSRLQPALELYGKNGVQLASNRGYRGSDALLDAVLPEDGDYQVRVCSFAYVEGSPDHFYRLTISTAPWIDAVFPAVVEPGKKNKLTVYGRNLPGKAAREAMANGQALEQIKVTVDVPGDKLVRQRLNYLGLVSPAASVLDGFGFYVHNDAGSSNPFLLTYAQAPVVLDNGANDTRASAQQLTLPCEIAGTIEKRGDRDWYAFPARKGEAYSLEMFGARLGSPLDLYFEVQNGAGKVLASADDNSPPAKAGPMDLQFFTRSEDPPHYRFVAPADGTYYLQVGSREASIQAGPRHLYRVPIGPEQPDFRLVAMPTSTLEPDGSVLGAGGHEAFLVHVWRLDGFNGPITLTGADLPRGISLPPQVIPAGQSYAVLSFSASADAPSWTGAVRVLGTATINGQTVVREVRSATITWPVPQATIPTISRVDRELVLAVRERPPFTLDVGVPEVMVTGGAPITVPVKLKRLAPDFKTPVQVFALNLPPTLTMQPVTLAPGKDEITVTLTPKGKTAPGSYALVFRGQTGPVPLKNQGGKVPPAGEVQTSSPVLLNIVPKEVVRISINPANVTLKTAKELKVQVRLSRLEGFDGPLKVRVLVPPEAKGITVSEQGMTAGPDAADFVLSTNGEAAVGTRYVLRVEVTATVAGRSLRQESKLSVNISK
jgi:hypothetical protein